MCRIKEKGKKYFHSERILNSRTLKEAINEEHIKIFLDGTYRGINDMKKYKFLLEKELQEVENKLVFTTFEYPLIKVYGSAFFSPIDYYKDNPLQEAPLKGVFIHVIPYYNKLIVIVGYFKSHTSKWIKDYITSWKGLTLHELEGKLTDLFATRIEAWGMSPILYNKISATTKKAFIEYWSSNAINMSIDQTVSFNLFENGSHG